MKIEIELSKKAKTELKLKMKNLGSYFGWEANCIPSPLTLPLLQIHSPKRMDHY